MDARSTAWLAYVPLPGLFLVPLLANPGDRFARFHAQQGGALTIAWLVLLALTGFLAQATGESPWVGVLAGVVLVAGVAGIVTGMVACGRGRFVRIRPVWDALSASVGSRSRPR